jgi:DNA-directed RNA polymerase subunit M/transcription elongation factor TFIIS
MVDFDEIRRQLSLLPDEELVSIFREHNEEQWRPEVFDIVGSILSERGITPSDDMGMDEEELFLDKTADLDLVTVGDYDNYLDAETDRLALETKGLKVWIFNKSTSMQGFGSGGQLRVLPEDLAKAKAILEAEAVPSSDLPDEIAEPPCPQCGSRNVTEQDETMESSPNSTGVWFYQCSSCGHKWSES